MAFTGNNPTLYNAAFNGALAGMFAGGAINAASVPSATDTETVAMVAQCTAFATEVDSLIAITGAQANITTAASPNTTKAPIAGITTASQLAFSDVLFGLCFAAFFQKPNTVTVPAPAAVQYAQLAAAVVAVYTAAQTGYAGAPGGTSLL